jgi:hypothetical protein
MWGQVGAKDTDVKEGFMSWKERVKERWIMILIR